MGWNHYYCYRDVAVLHMSDKTPIDACPVPEGWVTWAPIFMRAPCGCAFEVTDAGGVPLVTLTADCGHRAPDAETAAKVADPTP